MTKDLKKALEKVTKNTGDILVGMPDDVKADVVEMRLNSLEGVTGEEAHEAAEEFVEEAHSEGFFSDEADSNM